MEGNIQRGKSRLFELNEKEAAGDGADVTRRCLLNCLHKLRLTISNLFPKPLCFIARSIITTPIITAKIIKLFTYLDLPNTNLWFSLHRLMQVHLHTFPWVAKSHWRLNDSLCCTICDKQLMLNLLEIILSVLFFPHEPEVIRLVTRAKLMIFFPSSLLLKVRWKAAGVIRLAWVGLN